MSGHSKWSQIKRQKAVKDAKKGAAYATSARDIMVAVKLGGPDPAGNFRLRTAIDRAKAAGLPNDNIQRAIEKGSGGGESDAMEAIAYEGYGPGGTALYIEALTDNRHRTAGDIRSYFNKYAGNLGADGCVAWIFEEKGLIRILKTAIEEDSAFEKAIEAGACDFDASADDACYEVTTAPDALNAVCLALSQAGVAIASAETTRAPQTSVVVQDPLHAKQLLKLLDAIESHDDVQTVYANCEIDEALLESLGR
ncbi:MAG: YebC/PmpR family DNA-binding transcriptional regulator [Vampirovibrionales bacterium]|nr:YebC/PmpR family DNA-binding transcriptional regulator [Vampirovibrionales bacterium]